MLLTSSTSEMLTMSVIRMTVISILVVLIGVMVCCSLAPVIVRTEFDSIKSEVTSQSPEVIAIQKQTVIEYGKSQVYVWFAILLICALGSIKSRIMPVFGLMTACINVFGLFKSFLSPCLNDGGLSFLFRYDLTFFGELMLATACLIFVAFLTLSAFLIVQKKHN